MSKKVWIVLGIGIVAIVAAFLIQKFEVNEIIDEVDGTPETKKTVKKKEPEIKPIIEKQEFVDPSLKVNVNESVK